MLGIIKGNLVNEQGDVEIFGTVHGKVVTKAGYTYINPGSKVGGVENTSATNQPLTIERDQLST
jgi:hypothetical protein